MILHELIGKSAYVPTKPKPKKSPPPTKKPVEPVNTKDALNGFRQQLRRDAVLAKIQEGINALPKPKKASSSEEQKILDRMKELEDLQMQHENEKQRIPYNSSKDVNKTQE